MNEEYLDKKNIYLPKKMLEDLQQDADRFEAFRKNGKRNMNSFITSLLNGYYAQYNEERKTQSDLIKAMLQSKIKDAYDLRNTTTLLLETLSPQTRSYPESKSMPHLSYKPTRSTKKYFDDIEQRLKDGTAASLSQYLRDLFASYLSQPIYKRERIIFSETISFLEEACTTNSTIRLSSTSEPGKTFDVVCYHLAHSTEEMFNYLLCQGYNERMGKVTPFNMRISRIRDPRYTEESLALQPEIKHLLDLMIEKAPQFTIFKDEEACVQLTEGGMKTYSRIYVDRPKYERLEEQPDKKVNLYFRNSEEQLNYYFRRFAANEAVVLYPESLADKIKTFHEESWKAYCK